MIKSIKQCTLQDVDSLRRISIETFYQTFADTNTAENMTAYLEGAGKPEFRGEYMTQYSWAEDTCAFLQFN